MDNISLHNLQAYSLGASMLGSGGGGHPSVLLDTLKALLSIHPPVKLIDVNGLQAGDLVIPLAMVGAPLIFMEQVPTIRQFEVILNQIKQDNPGKRIILMPAEIGGCNALTPLLLAATQQLPLLDADLIGRAFPKIHMCKPSVLGEAVGKSYLSDPVGQVVCIDAQAAKAPHSIEALVREITVGFGHSAAIATFLFEGLKHHRYVIPGSVTRALSLGKLALSEMAGCRSLGDGTVSAVIHDMKNGFLTGHMVVSNKHVETKLYFQNEFLLLTREGKTLSSSPDIIIVIEKYSRQVLTTDSVFYGSEVSLYVLPAPDFWHLPKAKSVVSVSQFELGML